MDSFLKKIRLINKPIYCRWGTIIEWHLNQKNVQRKIAKSVLHYADGIFPPSILAKESLLRVNNRCKVYLAYNNVNFARIRESQTQNFNDGKYHIAFVGNLTERKDPMTCLQAFQLISENENFILHIIGEGPLKSQIDQFIQKNNLQERVIRHGFKKNPFSIMKGCNALWHTSLMDGFSLVLLESIVIGLQIFVADSLVGFLKEMESYEIGYKFKPGDFTSLKETFLENYKNEEYDSNYSSIIKRFEDIKFEDQYLDVISKE